MNSVQNENVEENKVLKNLVIGIQAIEKELGDALEKRREEVANTMVTQHIPEVENEEEVQSD